MAVKLVLVVRADLGMGRGKIAAQAAHAAVGAALAAIGRAEFAEWLAEGQPKVVLRVNSAEELLGVVARATAAELPSQLVEDAGRTQLPPGTPTCCAVGPAGAEQIDAITGELTLL